MKEQMLNKKGNGGITLIALVITIIVLLILAGVSIAMLTGENGILTQAQNSKTATEKAEAKERIQLEVLASYGTEGKINIGTLKSNLATNVPEATIGEETELPLTVTLGDYTFKVNANGTVEEVTSGEVTPPVKEPDTPTPPSGGGDVILTEAPTAEKVTKNTKYQDAASNNKIAVIPAGFSVVPGCTTIDEGLVISDIVNDTDDAGNQFVWIPVDETNTFERRAGYCWGDLQKLEEYGEADSTGSNTNTNTKESSATQLEAKAMYKSVNDNGGFYIGRYETGVEGVEGVENVTGSGSSSTSGSSSGSETGIRGTAVCKKGANPYNNIGWNNDTINNDITVETGGAVEVARNFATVNGYDTTQVHSTLCYGVQWDTALNFIDPGYKGYVKDSNGKGWNYNNYNNTSDGNAEVNPNKITGKDLIYTANPTVIANRHKNIYDMAGNIWEYTMEADDENKYRVHRGGSYEYAGNSSPASMRGINMESSNTYKNIGFRLALYV